MTSKVRPGQRWKPPRAIDENAKAVAADAYRKGPDRAPERQQPTDCLIVRLRNDTGAAVDQYSVLRIEGLLLDSINDPNRIYEGTKATLGNQMVAALRQPAPIDGIVEAQLTGVGLALVNVGATWHRRAYPTRDATVLTSGIFGPVEILGEIEDTGSQTCLVRMGHCANRSIMGVVQSGGITAATYASSDLTMGSGDVVLLAPHATTVGKYTLTSGDDEQEITAYNMALGAIDADKVVLLTPSDDWLPVVEIESCE